MNMNFWPMIFLSFNQHIPFIRNQIQKIDWIIRLQTNRILYRNLSGYAGIDPLRFRSSLNGVQGWTSIACIGIAILRWKISNTWAIPENLVQAKCVHWSYGSCISFIERCLTSPKLNIYGNMNPVPGLQIFSIGMVLYCNTGALVLYLYCIALKKLVLFILDGVLTGLGQANPSSSLSETFSYPVLSDLYPFERNNSSIYSF